jgi:hypothetical protein
MPSAQSAVAALTRECRTDHFLDVKTAAKSLGIHPNKVSDWIYRTGEKIKQIYRDQPGLMAAQMALWAAQAEAERESK